LDLQDFLVVVLLVEYYLLKLLPVTHFLQHQNHQNDLLNKQQDQDLLHLQLL
jgi:hypothetical protein